MSNLHLIPNSTSCFQIILYFSSTQAPSSSAVSETLLESRMLWFAPSGPLWSTWLMVSSLSVFWGCFLWVHRHSSQSLCHLSLSSSKCLPSHLSLSFLYCHCNRFSQWNQLKRRWVYSSSQSKVSSPRWGAKAAGPWGSCSCCVQSGEEWIYAQVTICLIQPRTGA